MAITGHTVPLTPSVVEEETEKREPPLLEPPAVEGAAKGLAIVYICVTLNNLLNATDPKPEHLERPKDNRGTTADNL